MHAEFQKNVKTSIELCRFISNLPSCSQREIYLAKHLLVLLRFSILVRVHSRKIMHAEFQKNEKTSIELCRLISNLPSCSQREIYLAKHLLVLLRFSILVRVHSRKNMHAEFQKNVKTSIELCRFISNLPSCSLREIYLAKHLLVLLRFSILVRVHSRKIMHAEFQKNVKTSIELCRFISNLPSCSQREVYLAKHLLVLLRFSILVRVHSRKNMHSEFHKNVKTSIDLRRFISNLPSCSQREVYLAKHLLVRLRFSILVRVHSRKIYAC